MTILLFILILGLLVFVHELGHFSAARSSGITVEEFGFGFPPRIIGWKRGATLYSLNWIPFGGFVRLQGEQPGSVSTPGDFSHAPYRKQLLVMAAGVLMNAILAWLLMTIVLTAGVKTDAANVPVNHFIQTSPIRNEAIVTADSASAKAGLRNGDVVTAIDGQVFTSTEAIIQYVQSHQYPTIQVSFVRDGVPHSAAVAPASASDHPHYGFGVQQVTVVRYPWYIAGWFAVSSTADLVVQTLSGFWKLLHDLVLTASVSPDVAGPVGIAVLTGQVIQYGFVATLQFMAVLSVSLAVVNFLPLPALDGGRALFITIGKLRGRPLNTKLEATIHAVGFYLLILAVILLSIRDVSRFNLLQQLRSVFH